MIFGAGMSPREWGYSLWILIFGIGGELWWDWLVGGLKSVTPGP